MANRGEEALAEIGELLDADSAALGARDIEGEMGGETAVERYAVVLVTE